MFEKMFKGTFILTVWGFIIVAVCAMLPDAAWEKFPEKLHPVREFLAQKNIISSAFLKENQMRLALIPAEDSPGPADSTLASLPTPLPSVEREQWREGETTLAGKEQHATGIAAELPPLTSRPMTSLSPVIPVSGTTSAQGLPLMSPLPNLPASTSLLGSTRLNHSKEESGLPLSSPGSSPINLPPLPMGTPTQQVPLATTMNTEPSFPSLPPVPGGASSRDTLPNLSFEPAAVTSPTNVDPVGFNTTSLEVPPPVENWPIASSQGMAASFSDTPSYREMAPSIPPHSPSIDIPSMPNNVPLVHSQHAVHPQHTLAESLAMAKEPTQLRTAFLKLNQLLEQHGSLFSPQERDQIHQALDRLAYTIFYDPRQHILEPAYSSGPNETLTTIATQYKITPELLAALNGLDRASEAPLPMGTALKVIRGPVSASVSLSKKELLLLFDGLYAGRFQMGYSASARNQRGLVSVTQKIQNPQYVGPLENGQWGEAAGGAANNPLGACWIALNNGLGLQGTNHPEYIGNEVSQQGGLIFSNKDILHLAILLPAGANIYLKD